MGFCGEPKCIMGPYFNEMIRIRIQIGNEIPHIAGMWDFCAEQITSSHLKCAKVLPDHVAKIFKKKSHCKFEDSRQNPIQCCFSNIWIFARKLFWLTYPIEGGWVIGNRVEWNFEKINLFPIVFWQKPTEFISVWWGEIQNIIFNSLVLKEKWAFLNWAREAEGRPSEGSLNFFRKLAVL